MAALHPETATPRRDVRTRQESESDIPKLTQREKAAAICSFAHDCLRGVTTGGA